MRPSRLRAALLACSLGLVPWSAGGAPAHAAGSERVGPLRNASGSCSSGSFSGTPTDGLAVIANTVGVPNPVVIAVLVPQGLTPNTTFGVALVQTPSGENCFASELQVTTDALGFGVFTYQEPLRPETTGAFVLVQAVAPFGLIASSPTVAVRPAAATAWGTQRQAAPNGLLFGRR